MTTPSRRKLTTVMSADVAGDSRLMDADETETFERLITYRKAMVGLIERHQGRVVNTAGDSLLAEFDSVVEAVQCAAEIQRELRTMNRDLDDSHRMLFRIGINLGDVLVEGSDLYGEGVNIAARLQSLAEPGGIFISGTAYDQVRNKLTLGYEFIGEQQVKNIAEKVPVYRVSLDASAAATCGAPPRHPPRPADPEARCPQTCLQPGRKKRPPHGGSSCCSCSAWSSASALSWPDGSCSTTPVPRSWRQRGAIR